MTFRLSWPRDVTKKCLLAALLLSANINLVPITAAEISKPVATANDHTSIRNELQRSIDRGFEYLLSSQNTNDWWQTADHPAVTALILTAFNGDPMDRYRGAKTPDALKKGYAFVLSKAQPDGSISVTNLPTYNTSVSMMALLTANNPRYDDTIRNARKFLVGVQRDFGEPGQLDTPYDGGFGYGLPSDRNSDMSNTILALEALHYSKRLVTDRPGAEGKDLNWAAAIHFLESCQNLPGVNKQDWASDDPKQKGGFIYNTGRSNAGSETNAATGRVTWRSYGSISYAGMLAYIYADLSPGDPRVKAVAEWLDQNYTLEENPGMKDAGLYYYYHTLAKTLSLAGRLDPKTVGPRQANWREDLALKMMQLQQKDGSWSNTNARWWEKEQPLATAYSLLTLENIWRALEL
jgi:squalene-hopene/tetraprenyl-beta-curcumene cyclase